MWKTDKLKNLKKANILDESKFLENKGLLNENTDVLEKSIIMSLLKNGINEIDFDLKVSKMGDLTTLHLNVNGYEVDFIFDIERTQRGYNKPAVTTGPPENWSPDESEGSEFEYELEGVNISKDGQLLHKGKYETFDELFNKKIVPYIEKVHGENI